MCINLIQLYYTWSFNSYICIQCNFPYFKKMYVLFFLNICFQLQWIQTWNLISVHIIPFHLFLLKSQIQSDHSSLIYTRFLLKMSESVFTRLSGKKVKSSDAEISLYFVFSHSVCVIGTVIQQNKYFLLCHIRMLLVP